MSPLFASTFVPQPRPPRSRFGCLGCLPRLVLILAFGAGSVPGSYSDFEAACKAHFQ